MMKKTRIRKRVNESGHISVDVAIYALPNDGPDLR